MLPTMRAMHTQYTVDHGCLEYCSVACERVKSRNGCHYLGINSMYLTLSWAKPIIVVPCTVVRFCAWQEKVVCKQLTLL